MTLSNGEIIWDLAGNVWEWTSAWILGCDQPTLAGSDYNAGAGGFGWQEYTAINKRWGNLGYANPTNRGWNSSRGLGRIYSIDDTVPSAANYSQYGFIRGGSWYSGSNGGAFALNLNYGPASAYSNIGFRVARSIL